jgi:hypothetical protein
MLRGRQPLADNTVKIQILNEILETLNTSRQRLISIHYSDPYTVQFLNEHFDAMTARTNRLLARYAL